MPSGNWDEWNSSWVISNLLDEVADFLGDFLKSGLAVWWLSGVHLVASNDELLDSKGVGKESVLSSLSILGDTSLELSSTGGNDQDTAVSLK